MACRAHVGHGEGSFLACSPHLPGVAHVGPSFKPRILQTLSQTFSELWLDFQQGHEAPPRHASQRLRRNIAWITTLPVLDCLNCVQHLQPRRLEDSFLHLPNKEKQEPPKHSSFQLNVSQTPPPFARLELRQSVKLCALPANIGQSTVCHSQGISVTVTIPRLLGLTPTQAS